MAVDPTDISWHTVNYYYSTEKCLPDGIFEFSFYSQALAGKKKKKKTLAMFLLKFTMFSETT